MPNEIFASAGTEVTSPATCIGGRLARIGRNGSTTMASCAGARGVAATGTTSGATGTGTELVGGAAAGVCAAILGGTSEAGIWNGIRVGAAAGGAAGGTGDPLEAGTRGNAGPPVPIGKDFSGLFSTGALGETEVIRAIEPSWVGSVSIRGGKVSRLVGGAAGGRCIGGGIAATGAGSAAAGLLDMGSGSDGISVVVKGASAVPNFADSSTIIFKNGVSTCAMIGSAV
jgi:hypothetical protein